MAASSVVRDIEQSYLRQNIPEFRSGDTVKVHAKIVEGSKERIQVFEGVVIKSVKSSGHAGATFTVRKISYNIGVERTFLLHSPLIEKIEVIRQGSVRRSRLFYLRPLRGKAARIKTKLFGSRAVDASGKSAKKVVGNQEAGLNGKQNGDSSAVADSAVADSAVADSAVAAEAKADAPV